MPDDLLEVAKLGRTIGLKGAVKIFDRSDFPSQFKKGAKFYLRNGEILEILSFNGANFSATFKNYENVEAAANLTNQIIYRSKEDTRKFCKLQKGEFFYFDIIGLEIYEDGAVLGRVRDISQIGSGYLFEVETDESLISQALPKEFFIPYVDAYVKEISLSERKIFTQNARAILENS